MLNIEKSILKSSLIKRLVGRQSAVRSTTLITMYIPGSTKVPDVTRMITAEISQSKNIKSRQTRQGVQDSLQHISSQLTGINKFPTNGVVIVAGATNEGVVNTSFVPPRPIDRFFYRCGSEFYL
ncbi:Translation termination factor eRF1 [uncultured virus]|nr:Translation termination factor eRF1 [uncultured virus]